MADGQLKGIQKALNHKVGSHCGNRKSELDSLKNIFNSFFSFFIFKDRRLPSSGFVPYGIGQNSYRPCICNEDQSFWRDNNNRRSFGPSTHRPQRTDDKLEYPFSETD